MSRVSFNATALAMSSCLFLAACSSATTMTPSPKPPNISGDYTGTMQDTLSGKATAAGTLAQQGSNAGGSITETFSNNTTLTPQMTITVNSSNGFSGAIVIDYPNGNTCTFATTGAYSSNGTGTPTLSGSYSAVTGCGGDTGTFALNQQCIDTVTSSARRPMALPAQC